MKKYYYNVRDINGKFCKNRRLTNLSIGLLYTADNVVCRYRGKRGNMGIFTHHGFSAMIPLENVRLATKSEVERYLSENV